MKKAITAITAAALLIACAGCGGAGSAGELNLFVWTEYMPDTVFAAFEKETGIKVNVSTYSSNEEMLAKVNASPEGTYDVVVPSDYMVKMMIDGNHLQAFDKSKVPNLGNIDPGFLNQSFDPGNTYSVPYMGGTAALVVNTAMVDEKITTCAQLFDPKYVNKLVVLDDFRAVIGMTAKTLGYSLNTTNDAELAEVEARLEALKPNVKLFDSDSPKSAMLSGETAIGYMWNAEIAICLEENDDFELVFPTEGCYLFLDNLCILKGAKNADAANQFLNFILRPDISKLVADEFPYVNPNAEAVKLLPDSYTNNPASNIDPAIFAAGEYVLDIGGDVEKYDRIWTRFTR